MPRSRFVDNGRSLFCTTNRPASLWLRLFRGMRSLGFEFAHVGRPFFYHPVFATAHLPGRLPTFRVFVGRANDRFVDEFRHLLVLRVVLARVSCNLTPAARFDRERHHQQPALVDLNRVDEGSLGLLGEKDRRDSEIAARAGFVNAIRMNEVFRRELGMPRAPTAGGFWGRSEQGNEYRLRSRYLERGVGHRRSTTGRIKMIRRAQKQGRQALRATASSRSGGHGNPKSAALLLPSRVMYLSLLQRVMLERSQHRGFVPNSLIGQVSDNLSDPRCTVWKLERYWTLGA